MLLVIAFACFLVMFAAWLMVPNADESKKATSAVVETPGETGAIPARA